MQTSSFRTLALVLVLLTGAALYALVSEEHGIGTARWPGADIAFEAPEWSSGPLSVDQDSTQTAIVSRPFRNERGTTAMLSLVTSEAPKLYAAGAEVPFLGTGYQVESPGEDLVPPVDQVHALLARRGSEQWLVLFAYGERRGLLGNGPVAWALAVFDGLVGHQNDYYKMYLITRADAVDANVGRDMAELAGSIFPQIARWYAATST